VQSGLFIKLLSLKAEGLLNGRRWRWCNRLWAPSPSA